MFIVAGYVYTMLYLSKPSVPTLVVSDIESSHGMNSHRFTVHT